MAWYIVGSAEFSHLRRSGETGRRAGLKIPFPSGSVGSTPTSGTISVELAESALQRVGEGRAELERVTAELANLRAGRALGSS